MYTIAAPRSAPEMPTMLKQHCECPFPFVPDASVADSAHMLCWEGNKMRMQQELEDSLHDIAASSGKTSQRPRPSPQQSQRERSGHCCNGQNDARWPNNNWQTNATSS